MNSIPATVPATVAAEISGAGSFFGSCQIASSNFSDFDAKLQSAMEESLNFSAVLKNFDQQQEDLENDELLNYPLQEAENPFLLFMQQNKEESEVMLQLKAILGDEAGTEAFKRIITLLEKGSLSVQKDMDNLELQDFEYLAKFLLERLELAIKQMTALSGEGEEIPLPSEEKLGTEETEREAFLNILIDLLKTGIITPQVFEDTLHDPEESDLLDLLNELKGEVKKLLAALEKIVEEPENVELKFPETKNFAETETKPEIKAEIKPDIKQDAKTETETKPEYRPDIKQEAKAETETKTEIETKPEYRSDIKQEAKAETETKMETETKPEFRPDIKQEAKAEIEAKLETETKPEFRPDTKQQEIAAEIKPKTKEEAKTEAETKPELRPDAKQQEIAVEIKPKAKQDTKQEQEAKSETRPEFKSQISQASQVSQVAAKAEPEVRAVWEGGELKIETVNPKTGEKLQSIPTTGSMVRMQERINEFEVVRQVVAQAKFIKTPTGEQRMTLQLNPEHLGQLSLRINLNHGEMQIHARVESATAQAALENHIGLLREGLEKQGINLERLEVSIEQREAKERQRRDGEGEGKDGKRKGKESMHLAVSVASNQSSDTGRRLGYNTMEYLA